MVTMTAYFQIPNHCSKHDTLYKISTNIRGKKDYDINEYQNWLDEKFVSMCEADITRAMYSDYKPENIETFSIEKEIHEYTPCTQNYLVLQLTLKCRPKRKVEWIDLTPIFS
jgi:hypothetical protein